MIDANKMAPVRMATILFVILPCNNTFPTLFDTRSASNLGPLKLQAILSTKRRHPYGNG